MRPAPSGARRWGRWGWADLAPASGAGRAGQAGLGDQDQAAAEAALGEALVGGGGFLQGVGDGHAGGQAARLGQGGGPLAYSDLGRVIAGISQKMLTQTLRALEHEGLVTRTVFAQVPPRVEYALTPDGAAAGRAVAGLVAWSEAGTSNR
jgi:DNA-binding HxlR family transcriptional regulator